MKRKATQHGCLPSLLSDGDTEIEIVNGGDKIFCTEPTRAATLQRQNLKQIFPEKEYRGLIPNFHIHVSVSELYIPTMGLPVLLEKICRLILRIYKSLKET
jgi:hypothetical protein